MAEQAWDRVERWTKAAYAEFLRVVVAVAAYLDGKKTNWLGYAIVAGCGLWLLYHPPAFVLSLFAVEGGDPAYGASGGPPQSAGGSAGVLIVTSIAGLALQNMALRAGVRKEAERTRAYTPSRFEPPGGGPYPPSSWGN